MTKFEGKQVVCKLISGLTHYGTCLCEYYSAIKRNELLSDERPWRNLKCRAVRERSQCENATYNMTPTI